MKIVLLIEEEEFNVENFVQKLIVSGGALLLFGILLALTGENALAYVFGGLGLFLALVGCFASKDQDENDGDQTK